ncbi:alpha/beta fold hydrolase [Eoetvoesiella caeni]|uniref:2-hydroxy-6-oxonona-2,4-dienedioate hydrolase n=1 Tax=Eoetvoesiella caeni TaxID=645616 RepID=A0A366HBL8_9BURK|nr:alpha/beta hydrolase [Eoetvoesiella caeni]MCI2809630.1 alpha/beta hydrolase [Eoetvoesiella caeni]NYT56126.1 alpha/beta hydrolase [Eoetvoesiella caeni]RBP38891.1 2-hydroxy-6-oxonona-2,4-dienedioate hydrolase [Eoetvoesiella caeni]
MAVDHQQKFHSIWADLRGVEFSQGWMDAGGINTRYLHAGDKNKPALILLHGVGGHAEAYVRNLKAHSSHFSTWAVDMVGHGWTDIADTDLEIKHYIDHLLRFMDAAGIEKASISGESLGGWVAARFAIDHPDRIDRLVLNTAGGSQADPAVMEKIKALSMRAATDPSWEFIKTRLEWLMADKSKVFDDLIATRQAIYSQAGMESNMRHCMILQDMEVRQRNILRAQDYERIKAPTLVLWTSDDPTADVTEGRRIASMIPGALFTVMEGCGHWPQFEDTKLFDELHIDFLLGKPIRGAHRAA